MNKYEKWYESITNTGKLNRNDYTEKHHILPKSLGGDDSAENLTNLTAREHFICHWLLTKIYPFGDEHWKMLNAFRMMRAENSRQIRYSTLITSRVYEKLKKDYSQLQSERYKGKGNSFYGKFHSEEAKAKISSANKGRIQPVHEKEKQIAAMTGRIRTPFSEEWKQNLSLNHKSKQVGFDGSHSEETRKKISNALKGRKQDEDVVKRRAESQKGLKREKKLCPYCGKLIAVNTYARYHGDNCKYKKANNY